MIEIKIGKSLGKKNYGMAWFKCGNGLMILKTALAQTVITF